MPDMQPPKQQIKQIDPMNSWNQENSSCQNGQPVNNLPNPKVSSEIQMISGGLMKKKASSQTNLMDKGELTRIICKHKQQLPARHCPMRRESLKSKRTD
jgi:hypothetical protein